MLPTLFPGYSLIFVHDLVPHFSDLEDRRNLGDSHAPFYKAWEVQVQAKPGSVSTLTEAATYSPDLLWTVIETDAQKSNTTQCTRLTEDKTPLSLVVNSQRCNLTVVQQ